MADQSIRFTLGSNFSGEGFKAAEKALRDNRKEIGMARAGFADLTKSISDVSPEAAKATSAVSSLTGAFMKGGIVGGVIYAAIEGISWGISKLIEKSKEAAEAAKKFAEVRFDAVSSSINGAAIAFGKASTAAKEANRDITDALKVVQTGAANEVKFKVAELHSKTIDALYSAIDDSARAVINAQAATEEAELKHAAACQALVRQREAEIEMRYNTIKLQEAADKQVNDATTKLAEVQNEAWQYISQRGVVEKQLAELEKSFADGQIEAHEYYEKRKDIVLKMNKLDEDNAKQKTALADAEKALESAHKDQTEATRAVTDIDRKIAETGEALAVAQAEGQTALKELAAKEREAAEAAEEAADAAREKALKDIESLGGDMQKDAAVDEMRGLFDDVSVNELDDDINNKKRQDEIRNNLLEKIRATSEDIRENTARFLKNGGSDSNESGLTSIEDVRRARDEARKAEIQYHNDVQKEYGGYAKQMIRDLDDEKMTIEELKRKYEDLFIASQDMSLENLTKLFQDMAADPMNGLKNSSKDFWKNTEAVMDMMKKVRESLGLEVGEDYKDKSVAELQAINQKLNALGLK